MGWKAVIDAILCGNHLNFKITVACGLFVYLCRKVRGLQTAATAKGINFDKERVERGQSTKNVAIIYEAITDLQKRRAKGEA
ncbi:MAG: hypothetical protein GTN76_08115 [Candidatus Aenigmarchaeota archaeon]|nr:hypothetical protein [Candidatus Aenigmarchaeota archaeon]